MDTLNSSAGSNRGKEPRPWTRHLALGLLSFSVLLAVGMKSGAHFARKVDAEIRETLLSHALSIAGTVGLETAAGLSFTAADKDNPHFQRLRAQMRAYARATGLRSLYSMAEREGRFVFGPESLAEDDPYASPPGTVYEQPSTATFEFFRTGRPLVVGPITDEYGTFISALAPVLDPRTGDLLFAIGVDMEVTEWRAAVNRARRVPLLLALILWFTILGGLAAMYWRGRHPDESRRWRRHAEAILAAAVGLELTLAAAWWTRDAELRVQRNGFRALARAQASIVAEAFRDLRSHLNAMARFFKASAHVDREEFRYYAEPLVRDGLCAGCGWVPFVKADEVTATEEAARSDNLADFAIWQWNKEGLRIPVAGRDAYFPMFYVEPVSHHAATLGFDMGSEPVRRAAIEEAARTDEPTATEPLTLFGLRDQPQGIVVFQAVSSRHQQGFASIAIRLDKVLETALRRAGGYETTTAVDLFQLDTEGEPRPLTSYPSGHACGYPRWFPGAGVPFPLFIFGKTYSLVIHPLPGQLATHPLSGSWLVAFSGLVLTTVLTVFIGFLTRGRAALEKEVRARTAELQARSDELERFFSSALDLLCIADHDGYFRQLNLEWEKLLGYSHKELMDRKFLDFVHPEDRAKTLKAMSALREGREVLGFVNRYVCRDGSHRWIEWKAVPAGPLIYASARDITKRRQAEEHLRLQAQLLNCVSESVVATDLDGRIIYWGPGAEKLYGYSAEEVMGRPFRDFGGAVEMGKEPFRREVIERGSWQGEHRQRRRDGTTFWTATFISVVRDDARKPCGFIGIDTDITERRRAEEALRTLSARQQALLAAIPDIIMEVDARKVYVWANQAGYEFFGEDVIGKEVAFYFEGEQDTYQRVQRLFDGEENVVYVESWQRRRDGQKRLLAWWCRVLKDEQGQVTGALSTARDITEHRNLEEQLRQIQKIEAIGRLAGGVAHDFNNMLGVILGHAELAIEQCTPEQPILGDLLEIQKAAERSSALTRQLLAFARKQTVLPRVLDLNETVSGMLKMLQRLIGEDIELVWRPGENLWPVRMDPVQVDQILVNLAVNARDAIANHGTLTVSTKNMTVDERFCQGHPDARLGDYVLLEVHDTGAGMDETTLEHIFEPFFTTKDIGRGVGLGLATVYGIVRQNGGFIMVSSRPGEGATFSLYLPRVMVAEPEEPTVQSAQKATAGMKTVLLVEDFTPLGHLCKGILDRAGYRVLTADSAGEALALARWHIGPIHLLITDVIMPEMNGREVANQIRQIRPDVKILYMSGYTADLVAGRGMLEKDIHFIQKPFSVEAFTEKVRAVLDEG